MTDTRGKTYSLMRALLVIPLCLCFLGCDRSSDSVEDFNARTVTLPDGTNVKAEVMMNATDMQRGMMFRESFPEGRGMLFIHSSPGTYTYWMFQVKVPLDIVWMDKNHYVVEISENTPPCKAGKASECPTYGGHRTSQYVIELPAGYAKRHAVREGTVLQF